MRLNINLASQKYEDVRQFYVRWSVAIGLVSVAHAGTHRVGMEKFF